MHPVWLDSVHKMQSVISSCLETQHCRSGPLSGYARIGRSRSNFVFFFRFDASAFFVHMMRHLLRDKLTLFVQVFFFFALGCSIMLSTGLLDSGAFSRVCCSLRSMAAFSSPAFYSGAPSESDDDFSEEENGVPPPGGDGSDSTKASDEDHNSGEDSTVRIIIL